MEWQTRTLAEFIAASAPFAGKENPLLTQAHQISIDPDDQAADEYDEAWSPDQPSQVVENSRGSFERFGAQFGARMDKREVTG